MISRLLILYIIIMVNVAEAQIEPEVLFPLYFENALGDRDTVELGWDSNASYDIDEEFGEKDITDIPFNDNLDVRATTYDSKEGQTKRGVVFKLPDLCETGSVRFINTIIIVSRVYPVYMYWDEDYFKLDSCLRYSRFTSERAVAISNLPHNQYWSTLLSEKGFFKIQKSWFNSGSGHFQVSTEGGRVDTAWNFFVGIASDPDGSPNSVHDLDTKGINLSIRPNGSHVENSRGNEVNVIGYSILGQELLRFSLRPGEERTMVRSKNEIMVLRVMEGQNLLLVDIVIY